MYVSKVEIQGESAIEETAHLLLLAIARLRGVLSMSQALFFSALQDSIEGSQTALSGEHDHNPHCTVVATEAQRS